MDIEKFRSQWDDPEFRKSFCDMDEEPVAVIKAKIKARAAHEKRLRQMRKFLPKAAVIVILGLASVKLWVEKSPELPQQVAGFMLGLTVISVLNKLEKKREKYAQPKLWLSFKEFSQDECHRIDQNIRFDQWTSVLIGLTVIAGALYVDAYLSGGMRVAFWGVIAVGVAAQQIYYYRKIYQLKGLRDIQEEDLKYRSRNE